MHVFCILSGVILLSGCTAGGGNVKTSNISESIWYYNSANHSNTNNSYKAINKIGVINGSKSTYHTNKQTKAVRQENYDTAIDNIAKLPEFIMIHI